MTIPTQAFGSTGHQSSRLIFGAAALGGMSQERADLTIERVREAGLNHFDTAASYGESELRLAPFLSEHRRDVFLATKTDKRSGDDARRQLEHSLERLGVDQVDLIQLHNLTHEQQWQRAFADDGAVAALAKARDEGLVRFIGVTGHGTYCPEMHIRSLNEFAFDSVLVPYSYVMNQNPQYAADVHSLIELCNERGVAIQTIKAIARRRWRDDEEAKRFSWYLPITEQAVMARMVRYVLSVPGLFLNTTSDARLLETVFEIVRDGITAPDEQALARDVEEQAMEPLFVRDVSDDVMPLSGKPA
ncbi:MAG: aldo/keto reductase [Pseudomonadaceae bacterium]|nr:aldo/keto reductase [Pseudomonadaceae bacterium]